MKILIKKLEPLFFFLLCGGLVISCKSGQQPQYSKKISVGSVGKNVKVVRTTAYCHLENEPGAYGKLNAIGTELRYGKIRSAAADWSRYPLGTQFRVKGESAIYEVDDYGSALVGTDTLDLYKPTLKAMNDWGLRYVEVEIIKWGSFEKSSEYLSRGLDHDHVKKMYKAIQRRR